MHKAFNILFHVEKNSREIRETTNLIGMAKLLENYHPSSQEELIISVNII